MLDLSELLEKIARQRLTNDDYMQRHAPNAPSRASRTVELHAPLHASLVLPSRRGLVNYRIFEHVQCFPRVHVTSTRVAQLEAEKYLLPLLRSALPDARL